MINKKFLVLGATGLVGSQVAILLAEKGYDVTAMVRSSNKKIEVEHGGKIKYVIGDLTDENSIRKAVQGMDIVISSANGIIPQKKNDTAKSVNKGAEKLISICEEAGVERFVQSSVPTHSIQNTVPELYGKRVLEKILKNSKMQSIVVRNPAFMDVWLVMCGFQQGENKSPHATTKRNYGFVKLWRSIVGNFALKRGLFIAPGGANHGSPMIATRDVAHMMVGGALYGGTDDLLIEAGGKEWLTWKEIANIVANHVGRKDLKIIPMPKWLARLFQLLFMPFSAPIANNMGLIRYVATHQPKWDSEETIELLNLPEQWSLNDYLDENLEPKKEAVTVNY